VYAQRNAASPCRQFCQHLLIDRELFPLAVVARQSVGKSQSDMRSLWNSRECGQEGAALRDYAIVIAIAGVGVDQTRTQGGTTPGRGELLFKKIKQLRSFRSMEVSGSGAVFLFVLIPRRGGVQDQRQNAVEKPGRRIGGGDVFVKREIARAEADGFIRLR